MALDRRDERNLSLKEAATRLNVSPHTLRFWCVYRNWVPYIKAGRRVLIRPGDLEAFEAKNRVEARSR
jgi:hypothetical protein